MSEGHPKLPKRDSSCAALVISKVLKVSATRNQRSLQQQQTSRSHLLSLLKDRAVKCKEENHSRDNLRKYINTARQKPRCETSMGIQRCETSVQRTTNSSSGWKGPRQDEWEARKTVAINRNLAKECERLMQERGLDEVERMIFNVPSHLVAVFKDYLIYDDINEFLHRTYTLSEVCPRLAKISQYYKLRGKFLPSYAGLETNKVLKKGKERKEKILRLKCAEELSNVAAGSTFFNSKFLNSMAREDLSNSCSRFPADSLTLESQHVTPRPKCLLELLKTLDDNDTSRLVLPPETQQGKSKLPPQPKEKKLLSLYISARPKPPPEQKKKELKPRAPPSQKPSQPEYRNLRRYCSQPKERSCRTEPSGKQKPKPIAKDLVQIIHENAAKMRPQSQSSVAKRNDPGKARCGTARTEISLLKRGDSSGSATKKNVLSLRASSAKKPEPKGRNQCCHSYNTNTVRKSSASAKDVSALASTRKLSNSSRGNSTLGKSSARAYLSNQSQTQTSVADLKTRVKQKSEATHARTQTQPQTKYMSTRSVAQINSSAARAKDERARSGSREFSTSRERGEFSQRAARPRPNVRPVPAGTTKPIKKKCMGITSSNLPALFRPK